MTPPSHARSHLWRVLQSLPFARPPGAGVRPHSNMTSHCPWSCPAAAKKSGRQATMDDRMLAGCMLQRGASMRRSTTASRCSTMALLAGLLARCLRARSRAARSQLWVHDCWHAGRIDACAAQADGRPCPAHLPESLAEPRSTSMLLDPPCNPRARSPATTSLVGAAGVA
jgi:hypothetical protein